jgi:hypothetical protein
MLRRPASSGPASSKRRFEKANRHDLRSPATDENSHFFERDISAYGYFQGKPSMVAQPYPDLVVLFDSQIACLSASSLADNSKN